MPTGYTEKIYNNQPGYTFAHFAWTVVRMMGACSRLRDDDYQGPLRPEDIERVVDRGAIGSAEEDIAKAQAELDSHLELDDAAWQSLMQSRHQARAADDEAMTKICKDLRERYEAMLRQVEDWSPPTPDHETFKRCMVEQLKTSIEYDCTDYGIRTREEPTLDEFRGTVIRGLRRRVDSAREHLANVQEGVLQREAWLKSLMQSIPLPTVEAAR